LYFLRRSHGQEDRGAGGSNNAISACEVISLHFVKSFTSLCDVK
jgi:hypothetical protein